MQINRKVFIAGLIFCLFYNNVAGVQNHTGVHDPSSIIKSGDTYWIFATGNGISSLYSTDLIKWTYGENPFVPGTFPSWVTTFVPNFGGHFWAPECFFMNGKYYLYYSCSEFGEKTSVIGLLTNPTLDPASPDFKWNDEGYVVYSTESSDANCIDPAVYRGDSGKVYLTYGSWFDGIRTCEIDTVTGKPVDNVRYTVAKNGCEASYVFKNDSLYYLMINRGTCCSGLSSTYYILAGRSASPVGPFLDKNGVNLANGGGTTILSSKDKYIGPGHFGLFTENGVDYVSYHYYHSDYNGNATLAIAQLQWDNDGWPVISHHWIENGTYTIVNSNSDKVWTENDCSTTSGSSIVQDWYQAKDCQKWKFTQMGGGLYKISPLQSQLAAQVFDCDVLADKNLESATYTGEKCQFFQIERANDGRYVISTREKNYVIDVRGKSMDSGAEIKTNSYSQQDYQKWAIQDTSLTPVVGLNETGKLLSERVVYPNPVSNGKFTIGLNDLDVNRPVIIKIFSFDGKEVFNRAYSAEDAIELEVDLEPGLYVVNTGNNEFSTSQRVLFINN